MFLVYSGKLTFSPTRHFLFHLPYLTVFSGYGLLFLKNYIFRNTLFFHKIVSILLIVYVSLFFLRSKDFIKKRFNKLDETQLIELAMKNKVNMIIVDDSLADLTLMNQLTSNFPTYSFDSFRKSFKLECLQIVKGCKIKNNILWISNRNNVHYMIKEEFIQSWLVDNNTMIIDLIDDSGSMVEVDFSNRTNNGRNDLFISLIKNDSIK
jgi:hypothetical protein